jgi:hypothetical protein
MSDQLQAQTSGKTDLINSLDREFVRLHLNSCALLESTPAALLYQIADHATLPSTISQTHAPASVGESVLRSAAIIEQTFGGITANLWDDPFEWTLPEYLTSPGAISEYLAEVEATRQCAFNSFTADRCLKKRIVMPSGDAVTLIELLRETLRRASAVQARALLLLEAFSGISPCGFII